MYLYLVKNVRTADSRELLKRALARYSGGKSYAIGREEQGKPYVIGEQPASHQSDGETAVTNIPFFSISHSGNYWGCLVGECEMGLDLEDTSLRRGQKEKVAQRFFSQPEKDFLQRFGIRQFPAIWVRKEAYVKYLGTGLAEGLSTFSVVDGDFLNELGPVDAYRQADDFISPPEGNCFLKQLGDCWIQKLELAEFQGKEELPLVGAYCTSEPAILEKVIWFPARSARETAILWLQNRERCTSEVRRHLKEKGYSPEEVQEALGFLEEYRYLDDQRFCQLYIQAARKKGKGRLRIRQELMQKGVDSDTADQCLDQEAAEWAENLENPGMTAAGAAEGSLTDFEEEYTEADQELAAALQQAEKILRSRESAEEPLSDKEKAKMFRRLAYLGYGASTVYRVIERISRKQKE